MPLYAQSLGWDESGGTRLIAILMVGAIALQLPIGWLADTVDRRRLVVGLSALAGVGALAWPFVLHTPWLAYAVVFVWGGLLVGIYTTFLTILGSRFEGPTLVGVFATVGLAWGAGALAGPVLVGAAAALTDHALPLCAGAACLAFAIAAALRREPT
jgi:MFS family permease